MRPRARWADIADENNNRSLVNQGVGPDGIVRRSPAPRAARIEYTPPHVAATL
jgi:hypothetical protein